MTCVLEEGHYVYLVIFPVDDEVDCAIPIYSSSSNRLVDLSHVKSVEKDDSGTIIETAHDFDTSDDFRLRLDEGERVTVVELKTEGRWWKFTRKENGKFCVEDGSFASYSEFTIEVRRVERFVQEYKVMI